MTAGPNLDAFNTALDIASGNIGEVQDAVASAREGAQDIRWAVGTFGRIENKADEVAKILGGFGDVLDLLGKVGPLRTVFNPLERVMKDLERAVEKVEAKAKQIDESALVVNLKNGTDDAIARIKELEDDVGDKRDQFDERREPVQEAVDTFNQLGDAFAGQPVLLGVVLDISNAVDSVVAAPKDAALAVNALFGSESDPDSVAGKLAAFNDAVDGNPLRSAQKLEDDLCAIIDELGFLSKPFDILNSALKPIRWALDASDFVFDKVISPVLDPILDAIGVNELFDGVRKELSKLLPDIKILEGFDTNGILPDLNTQLLPSVDLGDFWGLTDLIAQANIAIDISVFDGDSFSVGTDGNDVFASLTNGVRHILSGGAGIDRLIGSIGAADIFSGGAGDDEIDGGDDESSGDMVVFSGNISEYLIEFAGDATEFTGDIFISHVAPAAGLIGDGIDTVRNIETFVFDGLEITANTLRNGLKVLDSTAGGSASVVEFQPGLVERGFLIATEAGDAVNKTGMNLSGDEGDDHLIGTAYSDQLFGLAGNDVLDGGPNDVGFTDDFDGGTGLDEVTFASSIRASGEFIDIGQEDRGGVPILPPGPDFESIERIEGSSFDDVIFGREVQNIDGVAANGTYVERLAGGDGSDVLRGFGGDDRLEGNEGNDILIGDGGANQLLGGIGDDVIVLDPTAVGQQVDGGTGFDVLFYGSFASVVSTFDTSVEGWTADSGVVSLGTASGVEGDGAYLQMLDTLGPGVDVISAPAAFLGDQSQMLGGRISFDLDVDNVSPYSMGVTLVGGTSGTTRLEADIRVDPAAGWQSFAIALDATGSWRTAFSQEGFGGRATDERLADVLSNLTAIEVNADRSSLVEVTRLDNFALSAVPVATSLLSTFEAGTEGWTVGNKSAFAAFSTLVEGPEDQIDTSAASFSGAAGRSVEAFEGPVGGPTSWFIAPDKFLGDQSEMIGGQLEFSTRQTVGTSLSVFNDREVALVGNGFTLITDMVTPGGSWERRSVDLIPDQWFIEGAGAVHPTQAQFEAILSNLEGLYIRGEYRNGTDQVGLDEVRLTPAPDGLSAKALKFADLTMNDIAVPDLQGEIEVDVAAGVVTRFDQNGVQIAQDTFSGIERIYGGNQDDLFLADLAAPGDAITVNGGGGADRFQVGVGQQVVYAGDGDDLVSLTTRTLEAGEIYDGGRGTDTLDLSQIADARWSLDFDSFLRGGDWTLSDEDFLALETAQIAGLERVITGDFDDQVFGRFSYIDTGAGNDFARAGGAVAGQQIFMGAGDDEIYSFDFQASTIDMGLGNDLISVYGGLDGNVITVIGGPGDSTDANGEEQPDDDVFLVGAGRVHLVGGDGQDIVSFGSEDINAFVKDLVLDLSDASQNSGGAANLTYEGIENASGASRNDVIRGDAGSNLLIGGAGDDVIEGEGVGAIGAGTGDLLYGNSGNDSLFGNAGDDVLHGGSGNNLLDGGTGTDTASYTFAEVAAVTRSGVIQSFDAGSIAQITANLGVTSVGTATKLRVLHQDDFEGGASGFQENFPGGAFVGNTTNYVGQGRAFGAISPVSGTMLQKTFDLGDLNDLPPEPITVSFDILELNEWNGSGLSISTPAGFIYIPFNNGVPGATSGTSGGVTWTLEADIGAFDNIDFVPSADDYVHRMTFSFTPASQFITLAFGIDESGSGAAAGNDRLALDNLIITASPETDTLIDIENITGGALNDDLTGDNGDNVLNGAAGNDILRGLGGNDILLDGEGADIVEAGDGDDTVIAGRGGAGLGVGAGDIYDGGAGFDVLDYSGSVTKVNVYADGTINTQFDIEDYGWADGVGTTPRLFDGTLFITARDIGETRNPETATSGDDILRDLSLVTSPAGDVVSVVNTVTISDTYTGFEHIIGSAFNDSLYFSAGVSILEGGLGNDAYIVEVPDGTVIEAAGGGLDEVITALDGYVLPDEVESLRMFFRGDQDGTGNASNNTIFGNNDANVLDGAGGNDELFGGGGDDTLIGGAGGDTLDGGAGNDIMDGGGGRDTASYASSSTGVRLALANNGTVVAKDLSGALLGDTLTGFENLTGTSDRDVLFGNGVDNVLTGGLGHDDLYGANGDDLLIGGGGNDLLNGGAGSDTVSYEGAEGRVAVFLANPPSNVGGGEGIDTFVSIENVIGSAFDDRLVGDAEDNHLIGGLGNDVLIGNAGNDVLDGGLGDDDLSGSGGDDVLNGGAGNDVLNGLGGADTLNGDGGDDEILGGLGLDTIHGGSGDDTIFGFFGTDTIFGGSGDDDIRADGSRDVVDGGAGNDRIVGGNGNDILWGGAGNDVLFGGGGDGSGDGRRDVFVFKSIANGGGGADRVRDFEDTIDKIDLSESGYTRFVDLRADASQDGADVVINFDFGGTLTIENISLSDLNAGDFIF